MPVQRDTRVFFTNPTTGLRAKSVASVTGRIGYGWDRFLGYVKGGGAWERDELTFAFTGVIDYVSDTRSGWTIGIGGEYAFTNWLTGFVEYDYYDFGSRSNDFVCGPIACFVGGPVSAAIRRQGNQDVVQSWPQFPVQRRARDQSPPGTDRASAEKSDKPRGVPPGLLRLPWGHVSDRRGLAPDNFSLQLPPSARKLNCFRRPPRL